MRAGGGYRRAVLGDAGGGVSAKAAPFLRRPRRLIPCPAINPDSLDRRLGLRSPMPFSRRFQAERETRKTYMKPFESARLCGMFWASRRALLWDLNPGRCRAIAVPGALLALTACASTPPEPIVRTVEISAPVAVSCVPDSLGGPPDYPDTDEALRAAPGPAERYQLLIAGREARKARAGETEPVIALCRVP